MLVRLVRMTFRPDRVDTFLSIFDESAPRIRVFPGCTHLELLQDHTYPNVLTTLSHWDHDDALQRYRASNLFRSTWSRTKPLFAAPPEAYSHHLLREHPVPDRA
ncbi:MAG: antibiotic biosynthesis monooxygenase [Rhodothermales bacterium]